MQAQIPVIYLSIKQLVFWKNTKK